MRPLLVAMLIALTAGTSSANTPVAVVGVSNDAWERPQYVQPDDCAVLPSEQVFVIEHRQMASAVRLLQRTSLRRLRERQVGSLLRVDRQGGYSVLAQQLLEGRIANLSEQRRHVMEEHRGSWSLADEQNLTTLRQRLERFREHPLAFYLVRALAADATHIDRIEAFVCDETVLTISFPTRGVGSRGRPDRLGLVVLLEARPEQSVPQWTYDDPQLNR